MKPGKFLVMLRNDFHYRIGQKVAHGRDLYYDADWVGYASYNPRTEQLQGFVIGATGNHLKTLCLLHGQRIIG